MKPYTERRLREVVTDRFEIDLNMPKEYPPIAARPTEDGGVRDRFFAAVAELPDEITVVRPFSPDGFTKGEVIYVAENGSDTASGKKDEPIATLHEALRRASGKGGAKIVLRGGNYSLTEPLNITKEHSGTPENPLIITAEDGEVPTVSGSYRIPASAFVKPDDEKMLARLKPEVREKVLVADLPSLGITEYGIVGKGEKGSASLILNSVPLDLARFPNSGDEPLAVTDRVYCTGFDYARGEIGDWEFGIDEDRCFKWEWHDDIYLYGALCFEWTRLYTPVGGFDAEKRSVRGIGKFDVHPISDRPNNTFYFTNVFEELDAPGEWYLDRSTGKMYLYPPKELTDADDIRFVAKECDLFVCRGAENVIIDRLDIGRNSGVAILTDDCRQVLAQRCRVTSVTYGMKDYESAVVLDGGFRNGIIASKFDHCTTCCIDVLGGDRRNLIPANNFAQNCIIKDTLNRNSISAGGCGNLISHNYLHNTTMGDTGHNEGIFEYNVCEGGDTTTGDSGMIYVAGGGLSSCGNHYRYNYFFGFVENDYGIYFDDMSRGMYAYGNVTVGCGTTGDGTTWYSGGRGYNHHGGGEHCFWNNITIDAGYFGFGGESYWYDSHSSWKSFFNGIYGAAKNIANEKYFGRNPTYRDFCDAVFRFHEDLKDPDYVPYSSWADRRLRLPYYNHYENNIIFRAARPYLLGLGRYTATGLETNLITNEDPGFVDLEGRNYTIRDDAPLYEKIPDFKPIPFYKMGPVDDFED